MKLTILKPNALSEALLETPVNTGAKRVYNLMSDDYIEVKFSLSTPIILEVGACCRISNDDGTSGGRFYLTGPYSPDYNSETGGYDYQVKFEKHYMLLKNRILKYAPTTGSQEVAFDLTATIKVHADVIISNLTQMGFTYDGLATKYTCSIDDGFTDSQYISYSQTSVLDAIQSIADAFDTEWWFEDSVLHFGKCEFTADNTFQIGKNVATMSDTGNGNSYSTRIIAFGSDRNLPTNYRETSGEVSVDGIVQKRLMLPESTGGYIDIYKGKTKAAIVEEVAVFEDIYPRTGCKVSAVETYEIEDDEGTKITCYRVKIYKDKEGDFVFSKDYLLSGKTLMLKFNSGKLGGMEFEVSFNPKGLSEDKDEAQLYELIRNEDYGLYLPNETLLPAVGDECTLYNWDSTKIASLGLVAAAEEELRTAAAAYAEEKKIEDSNYECTLFPKSCLDSKGNVIQYSMGEHVKLVNKGIWTDGRESRIIGIEYPLDKPYDSPKYTVGESLTYSKFKDLQQQINNVVYNGKTYGSGSTGGSGGGVYVISERDGSTWTDRNVLSSTRAKKEFVSATEDDEADGHIKFNKGATIKESAIFGDFISGLTGSGGKIGEDGMAELEGLSLRAFLEVPELRYKRVTSVQGDQVQSCASGVVESIDYTLGTAGKLKIKLEDGEANCFAVGDLVFGIYHMESGNATETADDGKGNRTVQGFTTIYLEVKTVTEDGSIGYYLRDGYSTHPVAGMTIVQRGNVSDTGRQSFTYYGIHPKPYLRMLAGVSDWEYTDANIALQMGYMGNMPSGGTSYSGYSAYLNNVYMTGVIKQLREDGGLQDIPIYRGEYADEPQYYVGDEVTYDGQVYICTQKCTGIAPTDTSCWELVVAKGTDGTNGVGVSEIKVQYYRSNSATTLSGGSWSTTRPAWQNGRYIWTRQLISYTNGDSAQTTAVCVTGAKGDTGADGKDASTLTVYAACFGGGSTNTDSEKVVDPDGVEWPWAIDATTSAGFTLFIFDKSTFGLVFRANYNTYAELVQADSDAACDELASVLESYKEHIVVVLGGNANAINANLRAELVKFGAGTDGTWTPSRVRYYMVGQYGLSAGQAYESISTDYTLETATIPLVAGRGIVANGATGAAGTNGLNGAIGRTGAWVEGQEYRNDSALTTDTRFVDTAIVTDSKGSFVGAYLCKVTHTSSESTKPGSGASWTSYWEEMSSLGALYTAFLLADNAVIKFASTNELVITDTEGKVEAGMAGTQVDTYPEIWAGGERGAAAIGLYKDGTARFGKGQFSMNANGSGSISGHSFTTAGRDMYTAAPTDDGKMAFMAAGETMETMTATSVPNAVKGSELGGDLGFSAEFTTDDTALDLVKSVADKEIWYFESAGFFKVHSADILVETNAFARVSGDRLTATATPRLYVITYDSTTNTETSRREIPLPVSGQLPLFEDSDDNALASKNPTMLKIDLSGLYFSLMSGERLSLRCDLTVERHLAAKRTTDATKPYAVAYVGMYSNVSLAAMKRASVAGFAEDGLVLRDGTNRSLTLAATGSGNYILSATSPLQLNTGLVYNIGEVSSALTATSAEWTKYAVLRFTNTAAITCAMPTGVTAGYHIYLTRANSSYTVTFTSSSSCPMYYNGGTNYTTSLALTIRRLVEAIFLGDCWIIKY